MIRNGEGALEAAASRLNRALETLEQRLDTLSRAAAAPSGADESLRDDLRSARERERVLEAAASEASATLGRAADQIRAALAEEGAQGADGAEPEPEAPPAIERPDFEALSDDVTDLHQPRFSYRNGDA
ncbi:MAG: hypothetical protein M3M95_08095 [Pseudomonadota bacterium]|nr:hypothetical protein [Pseudomonadota bacterium]